MNNKSILVIAFSNLSEYPREQLTCALGDYNEVIIISPFNSILRKIVLIKSFINKRVKENYKLWASPNLLKLEIDSCNLKDLTVKVFEINLNNFLKTIIYTLYDAIKIYLTLRKILIKNEIHPIYIYNVESSGYIVDSILRFTPFNIFKRNSIFNNIILFFYAEYVMFWAYLANFYLKNFDVLVNHQVYFESGWFHHFLSEKYAAKTMYVSSIINQPIEIQPNKSWIYTWVDYKKNTSIVGNGNLPWYRDISIKSCGDLRNKKIKPDHFLIAMHAFQDANDLNFSENMLFQSYIQWVEYTLSVARKNAKNIYNFRIHPDTNTFYKRDLKYIKKLFQNLPNNIILSDPYCTSFNDLYSNFLPIVITYKGSIAMEMAASGYRVIAVGDPYAVKSTFVKPSNINEYNSILSNGLSADILFLSDEAINKARLWKSNYSNSFL